MNKRTVGMLTYLISLAVVTGGILTSSLIAMIAGVSMLLVSSALLVTKI